MVQTNQNNDSMAQDQQEQRSAWKAENTAHGSRLVVTVHEHIQCWVRNAFHCCVHRS